MKTYKVFYITGGGYTYVKIKADEYQLLDYYVVFSIDSKKAYTFSQRNLIYIEEV